MKSKNPFKRFMILVANNGRYIISIHFGSLILGAIIFSLVETDRSILDGIWWAMVTQPTLGYGDVYPVTDAGRVVASFFIMIWSYFTTPLFVTWMILSSIVDKNEFSHDEQEEMKRLLKESTEAINALKEQLNAKG